MHTWQVNKIGQYNINRLYFSNRWTSVARPGLETRVFHWPCEHSSTELPSQPVISPIPFHLKPTPVTHGVHPYTLLCIDPQKSAENLRRVINWCKLKRRTILIRLFNTFHVLLQRLLHSWRRNTHISKIRLNVILTRYA